MLHLGQMKIRLLVINMLFLFISPLGLYAQPTSPQTTSADKTLQTITLKDGTVLKGHLTKVMNDIYVIQTQHMGDVQVHVSDLANITTGNPPSLPQSSTPSTSSPVVENPSVNSMSGMLGQGGQLQQQLLADPEIQAGIQELLKDPETMNLFMNGNLMQDAFSMDPNRMKNNQNVQQLMQNPKMQEIIEKVNKKLTGQNVLPNTSTQNQ